MKNPDLAAQLQAYVRDAGYQPQNLMEIEKALSLSVKQRGQLRSILKELETKGILIRLSKGRFALCDLKPQGKEAPITGRIRQLRRGKTLFIPAASCADQLRKKLQWGEEALELPISPQRSMNALDGDKVRVRLRMVKAALNRSHRKSRRSPHDMKLEVQVEEILQRYHQVWVGSYQADRQYGYVEGDGQSSPAHIKLTEAPDASVLIGMSVVVTPQSYPQGKAEATGKIKEVLGWPEDDGVDMQMLIRRHQLSDSFPPDVIEESKNIDDSISQEEYAHREDWRLRCVVTIDPDSARDFDDAISVRRSKKGWELAVHIADASHFVRPGSALDKEAQKRGNSTYLPDRVLPMLPPVLCDHLCSLKEGVDRLTLLCLMQLNELGQVIDFQIKPSVIRSYKRMTYGEVLQLIQEGESTGDIKLDAMLREAYCLSSLMRKQRFANGSLDLEMPSLRVVLDKKSRPIDITIEEGDDAHRLIEEFMLAANECIACTLREKMLPAVYRVHETPNLSRLQEFAFQVKQYGIKCGALNSYEEINWVVDQIKELPDAGMLKVSLLRSLMRARYSTQALGHFGLAKGDYCHFTSPIRRYADLLVHRSLHRLCGENNTLLPIAQMNALAEHISETERISSAAENEAKRMKLLQYLDAQCDLPIVMRRTWTAFVSAVIPRGVALEVPQLQLKGLIPAKALNSQERWYFEGHTQGWSSASGKSYRIGDCIQVVVDFIDHDLQLVDFLPQAGKKKKK